MAWFGCFRYRIRPGKNRVVCGNIESEIGSKLEGGGVDDSGFRIFNWDEVRKCTKEFEKVIDSGGFSVVYYGTLTVKQSVVVGAFKVHNSSERLNQGFKEELKILLKLNHPNIVKLYGYCDDQDAERGALVFEYVPYGTLHQLALALEYLHELHIVRGDIKSSTTYYSIQISTSSFVILGQQKWDFQQPSNRPANISSPDHPATSTRITSVPK